MPPEIKDRKTSPPDAPDLDADLSSALNLAGQAKLDALPVLALADRLAATSRHDDVVTLYRHWLNHSSSPASHIIRFNLGVVLAHLGRLPEAEHAYRETIFQKPDFPQPWFNLGAILERQGRPDHALKIWQSMLDHPLVSPTIDLELYLMVVNGMGRLLEEQRQFDQAELKLAASLRAEPIQPKVIQHWVHLRQKQCKWPVYSAPEGGPSMGEMVRATSPLAMLSASDDPGLLLAAATHFTRDRINLRVPHLAPAAGYAHPRLRVGFLSSDFCLHAVSLLTVELFELLDRSRFELYGYCWSREDGSELRARVVKSFDHFKRIGGIDDEGAARTISADEIDLLIDLQGLTSGARPNILAFRPAPVQLTYLGFPGPTGHPCVDYVIADRYLIPDAERPFYTETPLYLPKVFQCSDRQRPVAALPSRAECGLPQDKFVFCSFNNNYKFTQEMFECWMRILRACPSSILWLLADNRWSQESITMRAAQLGVAADRLYFSGRVTPAQYLARYTAADLFLDCYPFNGGTTANDALWMGLPVLTRSGRTFSSRMAGGLLTALDLPELITTSIPDYEQRAVEIATNPEMALSLKKRVADGRLQSPLFDMAGFARDFGDTIASVALRPLG